MNTTQVHKPKKEFKYDGKIATLLRNLNPADVTFSFNVKYPGKAQGKNPDIKGNVTELDLFNDDGRYVVPVGSTLYEDSRATWHIKGIKHEVVRDLKDYTFYRKKDFQHPGYLAILITKQNAKSIADKTGAFLVDYPHKHEMSIGTLGKFTVACPPMYLVIKLDSRCKYLKPIKKYFEFKSVFEAHFTKANQTRFVPLARK